MKFTSLKALERKQCINKCEGEVASEEMQHLHIILIFCSIMKNEH